MLRWISSYLSNITARTLFRGACSTSKGFDLSTPQGGVLSPFLFNVLVHRLLFLLPDIPGTSITCYADDICIHSNSTQDLQLFLHAFYVSTMDCDLVISPEKNRIFSIRNPRTLRLHREKQCCPSLLTVHLLRCPGASPQPYLHNNVSIPSLRTHWIA